MSSTSAVAVLAQGLRDLKDFAEGPDAAGLREQTGLTEQQIEAALAGEELPSREVTLALVGAWEGDVEAWEAYWGQIAELVRSEDAGGAAGAVPVAPEPSIITPMVAEEEASLTGGPVAEEAGAAHEPGVARADDGSDAVQEKAAEPEPEPEAGAAEQAGPARAADAGGEVKSAGSEAAQAGVSLSGVGLAESRAAEQPSAARAADADADETVEAEPEVVQAEARAVERPRPADGRGAERAGEGKGLLARVGIPVLVFVVGVGVGAFGDHAFSSKDDAAPSAASVPSASHSSAASSSRSSQPSPTPGGSSSTSVRPTSVAGGTTSSSSSSSSSDATDPTSPSGSTTSSGSTLGAYSSIQVASGYSVDFLSDQYHPAVGTANGPDTMGFFATSFVDGKFYADKVALLDPQETGSYAACLNATRYQHDVTLSEVAAGNGFCIHTETGHLVLVVVRRMPSSTDASPFAVVDVTVWQN